MCVFNLDLNTVSEQLLVTSMAREFQTVGAVQWKARSAKRVLVNCMFLCVSVNVNVIDRRLQQDKCISNKDICSITTLCLKKRFT